MPIDPSFAVDGAEWAVPQVAGAGAPAGVDQGAATGTSGKGFADMLSNAITDLQDSQTQAAAQSQALATGTAKDPEQVVLAVEHARLQMELASAVRTKVTDAISEVMRTQV
ncbi:MAG TPA: flagellar hook-basal body complex protein FliE [Solirubrobacteraceae bacterium]|jgi:flagellar hook-basal body complex protein FliE|nr:flagellar hook-basal body complex protein FliE [Solirubrobacteraceae bacterium]